jgi:hypothetical protein
MSATPIPASRTVLLPDPAAQRQAVHHTSGFSKRGDRQSATFSAATKAQRGLGGIRRQAYGNRCDPGEQSHDRRTRRTGCDIPLLRPRDCGDRAGSLLRRECGRGNQVPSRRVRAGAARAAVPDGCYLIAHSIVITVRWPSGASDQAPQPEHFQEPAVAKMLPRAATTKDAADASDAAGGS